MAYEPNIEVCEGYVLVTHDAGEGGNRGMNYRAFGDMNEARNWLLED